ncbi:hypothetical protein, partial [Listeria grandensis]|uniref:hypothetical protein n=1 Tax=Listeria grandensis TaxID=1494963 RepID=UPI001C9D64B0
FVLLRTLTDGLHTRSAPMHIGSVTHFSSLPVAIFVLLRTLTDGLHTRSAPMHIGSVTHFVRTLPTIISFLGDKRTTSKILL